jgi:hypothetical protein
MKPPQYIRDAAERGLELLRAGKGGDGLTEGTKAAARKMAAGEVSEEKIIKASAWGARHKVDLESPNNSNPKDPDYPAAGAVAHFLWGINPLDPQPARDWFDRQAEKIQAGEKLSKYDMNSTTIDADAGTISGVSLISIGEARGHRSTESGLRLLVDQTTLQEVYDCCCQMGSVKVKLDHGSGILSTIGFVDGFGLGGDKVTANLHIYDAEPEAQRIFEIAAKNPQHMGISLEFMGVDQEDPMEKVCYARCTEVLTAALVSDPAANVSLFSIPAPLDATHSSAKINPSSFKKTSVTQFMKKFESAIPEILPMEDPVIKKDEPADLAQLLKAFADHMAEYADFKKSMQEVNDTAPGNPPEGGQSITVDPLTKAKNMDDGVLVIDKDTPEEAEAEKALTKAARLGAEIAIRHLSGKMGVILPSSGYPSSTPKARSFSEIVNDETKRMNGDATAAMLFSIKNHPKEYAQSRNIR